MKDLRILFMGTPDFAVEGLAKILEAGYNVVGVVTAPDKPAGRGRKLNQSAVKKFALTKDLPVLQPTNLKSDDFETQLKSLKPNLQVVVAFRMLPTKVWKFPAYGTFNLHASILPEYRGAAPINWAVINGEKTTGVTTFFIDDKIDTGNIIQSKEIEIEATENVGSVHDRLMKLGGELIVDTLKLIEIGEVRTIPQNKEEDPKPAPKLTRENTKIDWSKDTITIYNLIRGLNPYPAAWCYFQNDEKLNVKIFDCEIALKDHKEKVGKLSVEKYQIKVATKDGYILINEIQLPGKRKMKVKDLLNGLTVENEAYML
ncbi:methionyl-tRNA formyltransferase [Zunongwangia profunda]|jgi:methionyl-tRNA formyltransferase|uniref:methionyl-tRNA formyltransferase n=1 Tax=Zunongwangia profunda TaxID=398743 RepID=UPI001D18F175|nr:methionyl-tRNA formyltransferase [Zunongwangia profunda]MCC4228500.1 methionyl-tRNA formyltransferase [Zunongwangia profunda]